MGKNPTISLKLNFIPNTLGCYGLIEHQHCFCGYPTSSIQVEASLFGKTLNFPGLPAKFAASFQACEQSPIFF